MKIFRSSAALLVVLTLGLVASAQESSEVASLRAKAVKGNGIAQYNLGLAYAQGRGIAADPVEAFVWLSLARENGARGRALDTVVGSLDKASLELAQQRLAERRGTSAIRPPAAAPVHAETAIPTSAAPENRGTTAGDDSASATLRSERDALAVRVNNLSGDLAELRGERERLTKLAGDNEKAARAAEARVADLTRASDASKAELAQARQALASLQQAPKSAPDTTALDAKARELQAALAELEAARNFGRQVEDTLNKVNDDRARVAATAAAELEAAKNFGRQVEDTLNKVNDQKATLEAQLTAARQELAAKPGAPAYPDLSGRVNELEAALAAARNAGPKYPDLRARVTELETQFAASQTAARERAEELARANTKLAGDETAFAAVNRELATAKAALVQANQALAAKPAAPKYPDLSGRVSELEASLTAARNAAPKYPDLSGRVSELEAQLTRAKQPAYPDLRTQVGELESKVATLNTAAAQAQQQVAALAQAKDTAEKALAAKPAAPSYPDLSGRVSELEASLTAARNAAPKYPDLSGKVAELQAQLAAKPAAPGYPDLSGRVHELETSLVEANRQLAAAQQAKPSYPNLSGRVAELESSLSAANTARTEALNQLATLAQAKDAAEKALAAKPAGPVYPDLSGRVRELETALADSSRQLVAAQSAKSAPSAYPDHSGRVGELEAALATAIQKFGAAEQARAEVTRQFDDFKSATAAAQRERTTLMSNLKMLEADKAALRRQAEAATADSNQLRTQVAALRTQAAAPKSTAPAYPDLSGKVAELQAQLAAKPAAPGYPDLSGRVGELEAALAVARNAAPKYPDLSARVTELETQLAAKPAAPAYPNLSDKVGELETKLASLTAASQAAQAQVASLSAERDDARRAQGELSDKVAKLVQEKTELAASKAAPAYPDLRERVAGLESDLLASRKALAERPAAPAYPDLSGRVTELEAALTAARSAAPKYPDLSARVAELEAQLTAKPVAPAYPDLSDKVAALTSEVGQLRTDRERMQKMIADTGRQLAEATAANRSRPVAPAYPDLSGKVAELEAKLAAEKPAAPAYPDLSDKVATLTSEVGQLRADRERMQKMIADTGRQLRDSTADASRIKELETQVTAAKAQAGGLAGERDTARDTIARLEQEKAQLAATKPAAPAYPDLSGRVSELEAQLAESKAAAPRGRTPAYPDLTGRVSELEAALAQARQQLAAAQGAPAAGGDTSELAKKLADTEDRLATSLRGFAALQRERDALAESAGKSAAAVTAERDALATQVASLTGQVEQLRTAAQSNSGTMQAELTRLNEAVAALQRSSTQGSRDLAATRALAQQLQGANTVLAGENYQLKTMLARSVGGAAPVTAPVAVPVARTHVVVAGDSLSRLSQRYYGNANRWQEIYSANASLLGPNGVLRVGTELRIP